MAKMNETYKYYDETNPVFKNVPLKKCNFTSEPTGHLEQAPAERVTDLMSDIGFNCSSGFNFSTDAPPYEVDQECAPSENKGSNSVNTCSGEPW